MSTVIHDLFRSDHPEAHCSDVIDQLQRQNAELAAQVEKMREVARHHQSCCHVNACHPNDGKRWLIPPPNHSVEESRKADEALKDYVKRGQIGKMLDAKWFDVNCYADGCQSLRWKAECDQLRAERQFMHVAVQLKEALEYANSVFPGYSILSDALTAAKEAGL